MGRGQCLHAESVYCGQVGAGGSTIGFAGNSRIAGGLAQQNAILMDGGDTRGFNSNGTSYTYPLESVAEFKIQTATYSAEFGRAGGGVTAMAGEVSPWTPWCADAWCQSRRPRHSKMSDTRVCGH